jgi:hypothetical protein
LPGRIDQCRSLKLANINICWFKRKKSAQLITVELFRRPEP